MGRGATRRGSRRARPGPGQPDRRAHRLQRRPRPAGRHRPRDPDRLPPDRRPAGRARAARWPTSAMASISTSRARRPARGSTTSRARPGRSTEAGLPLTGLRGVIASTLPPNAGLSSSAAIELAAAWALLDDAAPGVDRFRLAQTLPARGERLRRGPERADGPVRLVVRGRGRGGPARLPVARLAGDPVAARHRARRLPHRVAAPPRTLRVQPPAQPVR